MKKEEEEEAIKQFFLRSLTALNFSNAYLVLTNFEKRTYFEKFTFIKTAATTFRKHH